MRTFKNLYPRITDFQNLVKAAKLAQRGKRFKNATAFFNLRLEKELWRLQAELKDKTYIPGAYRDFLIYEPKKRMISAAPYRDRVVHHAIYNVLAPIFDPTFIYDSYATRKGKGAAKRNNNIGGRPVWRPQHSLIWSQKLQTRVPASMESGSAFEGVPIDLPGLAKRQTEERCAPPLTRTLPRAKECEGWGFFMVSIPIEREPVKNGHRVKSFKNVCLIFFHSEELTDPNLPSTIFSSMETTLAKRTLDW